MIIYLWSFNPLPINLRTELEIDAYPYGEYQNYFLNQMRMLSVFRYSDNEKKTGNPDILIPRENPKPISLPMKAYYSSVAVSASELKVIPWPNDSEQGRDLYNELMKHPIAKDGMAWFDWNIEVEVVALRTEYIEYYPDLSKCEMITGKSQITKI
tara:strand:+ start:14476 stop:14940 length:465 start_codon:yes stop_codon:yes gene_type:complete